MNVDHEDCCKSWERIKEKNKKYPYPPADIITKARNLFGLKLVSASERVAHIASNVCAEFPEWNVAEAIDDLVVDKIGERTWN